MAERDFELFSKIADRPTRLEGARDLARLAHADNLIIFDFDSEVGRYLASDGFAQTIPGGRAWRAALDTCAARGEVEALLSDGDPNGTLTPFVGKKIGECLWFFARGRLSQIETISGLDLIAKNLNRLLISERRARRFTDQNATLLTLTTDLKHFADALSFSNEAKSFLSHASEVLASSLDYDETLTAIAKLVTRQMADWCTVKVVGEDGLPRTVTMSHRDEDKIEFLQKMRQATPKNWLQTVGSPNVLRTGRSELYTEITDSFLSRAVHSDTERDLYRELGLQSVMIVPLKVGARTFGTISFASTSPSKRFHEEDLEFAEELARRAAIAIENAELYRRAERANRAKTDFLANMSHEIRTPLTAILGFADLMSEPTQSVSERLSCASVIRRNGEQLTRLIDEILDLTKIESERLDIEKTEFSLTELIEEVANAMGYQASAKSLRLGVTCAQAVPQRIISDSRRIRQVLANLIGNAIKFTSEGDIKLSVSSQAADSPSDRAVRIDFRVEDTGIGITAYQAARLFQPFFQADSSMTRKFGGTGLGLALSRKLAHALGGDLVWIEDGTRKGSAFVFSVRAEVPPAVSEATQLPTAPASAKADSVKAISIVKSETGQKEILKGRRVLIVDDAPDNRVLISRYLIGAGAEVDAAADGLAGAHRALDDFYDVVLMDLQMPQTDGFEGLKILRSTNYTRPVVALTAHAMRGDRERCLEAGFNDHLTKPIDRQRLIQVIDELSRRYVVAQSGLASALKPDPVSS